MKKLSRILAAGITAIVAVSMFAAPALAVEEDSIEETMCSTVGPQAAALGDVVSDGSAAVDAGLAALGGAKSNLEDSSALLGTTALAYVQALDGVGNVDGTADDFYNAALDFADDIQGWVDTVDELYVVVMSQGVNEAVLSYLDGLCTVIE